ncbi:hypothetical protein ASPACDRAFT_1852560 [Aspergillus aculeatus ATCC 16872]|uniref:Thioredoxin domain-containing protein n=1 Tax=Aspergillus aculeatus (strain ATCC 16872 / CBS 172.66 / WB 5094) TaxID=690307 RepID=A0A1L9X599_ASPA1|nr:uncharacterized protein ASPACDRAFT_1852560 [Aspergillus aculeatus ATCC 16872]OJK03625.1 hypothetical protein ASPACDRAFT_1852560 [Aspergillus aculeatus ATCC 16872]
MPILTTFPLPASPAALQIPKGSSSSSAAPFFLAFVTSPDPATGQSWCPDVRAAWPVLDAAFSAAEAPHLAVVEVGQKPEWKDLENVYRTTWKVPCIPTVIRYEVVEGKTVETGRLAEGEILEKGRLEGLIRGN